MKRIFLVILLSAALGFTACSPPPSASSAPGQTDAPDTSQPRQSVTEPRPAATVGTLSHAEVKAKLDAKENMVLVDVRTPAEFAAGHIPGAINVPNEQIGSGQPEQLPDLDAEILIYCRSGNRSRQAANKLVAMGYTQIYDFGGITSWPYEIVK